MTCIATDGKVMAGDGLCTGNGLVHGKSMRKVYRIKDGRIAGMCGVAYAMPPFLAWLESGGDAPNLPENFEALVIGPAGRCQSYNDKCVAIDQETPAVTGDGGAIALGAMLAGASPQQAVGIACERETSCGGTITVEALA